MVTLKLATLGLVASLLAAPALAQAPQTGTPPTARPAPPPASTTAPTGTTAPAGTSTAPARMPLVDINHASKEELDALPGVGAVRADAIIKGRPYKGKDELLRKKVLPSNVYNGIKDRIVARQS